MIVSELQRLRFPPDGDVERWVREGPPGHANYEGGLVEWDPAVPDDGGG